MRNRVTEGCVLIAAGVGGLLFSPVFGFTALVWTVGVVVVITFATAEGCRWWPVLTPWRPVLALLAGLLGVIETVLSGTTVAGLPTGESLRAVAEGVVHAWQLTLQSTWPARPDPQLLLFVPLAVLLACVVGIELLHRLRSPLLALLPSVAVVGLSQMYAGVSGVAATLAAISYALVAGLLLAATRDTTGPSNRTGRARSLAMVLPTVALGVIGAVAVGAADPVGRQPFSLKDDEAVALDASSVTSPLVEIADRLEHPSTPVFRYTTGAPVDRWSLVVLDEFDGVNWTPGGTYRRMGTELPPGRGVTTPTVDKHSATVTIDEATGPWLPSQIWPASVAGVDPLVNESRGTLATSSPAVPASYTISWWEPVAEAATLAGAAIDPSAPGGFGSLGVIPPGVSELADQAVGGMRPAFQTALVLERFFAEGYTVATGDDLPTGHGWPQLRRFLLEDKRGTSEQFAAGYVALARILGIPARLAVGFRAPAQPAADGTFVVRNADVLAWPEVAVAGVGWVPLDPTGGARQSRSGSSGGLAEVTAQARAQLPPMAQVEHPKLPADGSATARSAGDPWNWSAVLTVGAALLGVLVPGWVLGVPLLATLRAWRRRRGTVVVAVIGAWAEARDRLRAHGVPVTVGMTVRDLAAAARPIVSQSTIDGLNSLAVAVDTALWSGGPVTERSVDEAWAAVRTVRKGLGRRPMRSRLRAAVHARSLLPPRG